MHEIILKSIRESVYAPSGENCQPWRFEIKENRISIFNLPDRDKSIYNYKQRGSLVAHGCLVENLKISLSRYGYSTQFNFFPDKNSPDLIVHVNLSMSDNEPDGLYPYIKERHTNRKDYGSRKLSEEEKRRLIMEVDKLNLGKVIIEDNTAQISRIGNAVAVNEQIIFENKSLHDFFYEHILWEESEQRKAGGFYWKTLEFLPHQLKGVKLFKNWNILSVLNKIAGVSRKIANENAIKYASSAAFAAILIENNDDISFIKAGRMIQRFWLKATELKISVHPCTGVLYFMQNIDGGNSEVFSKKHIELISHAYKEITDVYNAENRTIPMLFRLGFADNPSARSQRIDPDVKFVK